MRLTQYINEKVGVQEALDLIFKNCDPYITESKGDGIGNLYRGSDRLKGNTFLKLKPRKDRKPKDSSSKFHNMANKYFKKHHGVNARSEGVFATNNSDSARHYGKLGVVFPIGEFSYLWNPIVGDLYWDVSAKRKSPSEVGFLERIWMKILGVYSTLETDDEYEQRIEDVIKSYKSTNLQKAIVSNNEVMLFCKEYYLIEYNFYITMIETNNET